MGCGSGRPLSVASAFPAAAPAAGAWSFGSGSVRVQPSLSVPISVEKAEFLLSPLRAFWGRASSVAAGVNPGEQISDVSLHYLSPVPSSSCPALKALRCGESSMCKGSGELFKVDYIRWRSGDDWS